MKRAIITFCLLLTLAVTARAQDADPDPVVFVKVDRPAQFPGGITALMNFLSANVVYPAIAVENGIQGKVVCQFIVNKDGSVSDIEVIQSGGDPSLDSEAVRVISIMPRWYPAEMGGKPVRTKFKLPVNFKLPEPQPGPEAERPAANM